VGAHAAVRARQKGREAKDHPALDVLVRAGFVAYGVVYLLLGWLALQLALGDRERRISKNGALRELAAQPWGKVALWAACLGFAGLVVFTALEAPVGHQRLQGPKKAVARVGSVVRLGVYAALGFSAAKVALDKPSKDNPDSYTAKVFDLPLGMWLVGAVGLGVIAYAVLSVVKGVTDGYRGELDVDGTTGRTGTALAVLGRVGYCARGIAFGIVGSLFVWAAVTHDADRSGGLDQALSRLLHAPLGPVLLAAVAAGFACYGTFNVAKARHHDS